MAVVALPSGELARLFSEHVALVELCSERAGGQKPAQEVALEHLLAKVQLGSICERRPVKVGVKADNCNRVKLLKVKWSRVVGGRKKRMERKRKEKKREKKRGEKAVERALPTH